MLFMNACLNLHKIHLPSWQLPQAVGERTRNITRERTLDIPVEPISAMHNFRMKGRIKPPATNLQRPSGTRDLQEMPRCHSNSSHQ